MSEEPVPLAREFLAMIETKTSPEAAQRDLRLLLDRLALAYELSSPVTSDGGDAQRADYDEIRARVSARFPDFGLYNSVLNVTSKVGEPEFGVGDAIDDITDIACELSGVVDAANRFGDKDALWCFRFGFENHWGRHLRALQLYLHERGAGAR